MIVVLTLLFISGLFLDQSGPEVVRVVRQASFAAGNRAIGAGRRHGTFLGHAYVHHLGAPED